MNNSKERRKHFRIPLLSEYIHIRAQNSEAQEKLRLIDISNGGCFVETPRAPKPNEDVTVIFELPGDLGQLILNGRVCWVRWTKGKDKTSENAPLGFGVTFTNVSTSAQKILDAYVIYLRNKQIITVSKRIVEEFFGQYPHKER